jgi:hypothetical protein
MLQSRYRKLPEQTGNVDENKGKQDSGFRIREKQAPATEG